MAKKARKKGKAAEPAGQPGTSETMLEMAAELCDPPKWAAMQLTKVAKPGMTVGEAMQAIESIVRQAIDMELRRRDAGANAIAPVLREARNKADFLHESWNPDAHVELTLTIADLRALHRLTQPPESNG